MRTRKFRGKRIDNGEWAYGYLTQHVNGGFIIQQHNENYLEKVEVIPETVGQLLAQIKRENGVIDEIFEDDLIVHGERILKALFLGSNTKLVNKEETTGILLSFNDGKIKVGNIHDNPELITN